MTDIQFAISIEPEPTPIKGNAMASGDDAADLALEKELEARLKNGDTWAWCTVFVVASIEIEGETFKGRSCLGCCSYANEADFKADGYYEQMQGEAVESLVEELDALLVRAQKGIKALNEVLRIMGVIK